MTDSLVDGAIEVLAATPAMMREMLGPLPDELRASTGADGWSARDVVAHLALRQRPAIIGRVSAILANPGGTIPQVPAELMDPKQRQSQPFDDLLREFADGRADAVALLRGVSLEQASWRGTLKGLGELTIADIIHHVAYHDLMHIAQAAQLASAPLEPLRGAMRQWT